MLILLLSVHEYRFTFIGTCMYISKATATASACARVKPLNREYASSKI